MKRTSIRTLNIKKKKSVSSFRGNAPVQTLGHTAGCDARGRRFDPVGTSVKIFHENISFPPRAAVASVRSPRRVPAGLGTPKKR